MSGLAGSRQKNYMRLSSSLQDFSKYNQLDLETGNTGIQSNVVSTNSGSIHGLQRENALSSFSKEKAFILTTSGHKKWVRLITTVTGFLFIFVAFYICSRYVISYWKQGESLNFQVILDCGSTGTRVYVYQWYVDAKESHGNLPIVLKTLPEVLKRKLPSGRAYQRMETVPGLDKLVYNNSGLANAIRPLVHWAEKQIPKSAHKRTPIFLYATAGVRRLPNADSKWLLDEAWALLKNSSFLCKRHSVKVITGMEEAYYGWIALNYHRGVLGSSPKKETYGALDLGGSSLQVTFETKSNVYDKTSLNLSIGTVNHHLSAYSLLGYGLDDAFDKSVAHLLKRKNGLSVENLNADMRIEHPCLQSGYKEQYICSRCSASTVDRSPLVGGNPVRKARHAKTVELIGAPQWEECQALAKATVNMSEWLNLNPGINCDLQPCSLGNNLPQPQGHFIAMSGFFVVFRFFNLTSDATLGEVLEKGQKFCEMSWKVAKNSVISQPFIEQYCFRAPYIVSLLRDGLHIMNKQVVIGSGSITWTLGVALSESGKTLSKEIDFYSHGILYKDLDPTTLVVLLFVSLLLAIFAFSYVGKWVPRFLWRKYLPLFRHTSPTAAILSIPSPFRFQRSSPVSSGDGRMKMPLSPIISGSTPHPFSMGNGEGDGSIELVSSHLRPLGGGVFHSYSSGSLGQMQFDSGFASFWPPNRSRLQSRRSQSKEDLSSSMSEMHVAKV